MFADELRKLEDQARHRLVANGYGYSRTVLAAQSGVQEGALRAWFNGDRTPRDNGQMMAVVTALALWAQLPPPSQVEWTKLKNAARSQKGGTRRVRRPLWRRPATWVLGIIATAAAGTITALLTSAAGGVIKAAQPSHPPFGWTVAPSNNAELTGCRSWLFGKSISQIPPRTFGSPAADETWARQNGGVDIQADAGCGGVITARSFDIALNSINLQLVPAGGAIPPPYTISPSDIEELSLQPYIKYPEHGAYEAAGYLLLVFHDGGLA
jgi:hypothetical protein